MVCSICNHPDRLKIDREIVQGKSHTNISREYGVNSQAVRHHAENHLSHQLAAAWEKKEMAESFDMLGRIETILSRTEKIFKRNYDKEKDALALKALSESRATLDLLAKISYALHQARLAELELSHNDYDSKKREEAEQFAMKVCDRLTDNEIDLLTRLIEKANGIHNETIAPGKIYPRVPQPDITKANRSFFNGPYQDIGLDEIVDYNEDYKAEPGFKRTIDPPYRGVKTLDPEVIPSKRNNRETMIARRKLERMI